VFGEIIRLENSTLAGQVTAPSHARHHQIARNFQWIECPVDATAETAFLAILATMDM